MIGQSQPHPDLRAILKRNRDLEKRFADTKRRAEDDFWSEAQALLEDVANAGAATWKLPDRAVLRSILDYWGSIVRINSKMNDVSLPALKSFAGGPIDSGVLPLMAVEEFIHLIEKGESVAKARIVRANLQEHDFKTVSIFDSQFVECNLVQSTFDPRSRLFMVTFRDCDLRQMIANGVSFYGCVFDATRMERASLSDSDFSSAILTDARFDRGTIFLHCNFTYAKLQGVRGDGVTFTDAIMHLVELSESELTNCRFRSAQLTQAKLRGTKFDGSDFTGASLQGSELTGASFVNCNLEGANFEGAKQVELARWGTDNWRQAKFDAPALAAIAISQMKEPAEPSQSNVTELRPRRASAGE